MHFFSASNSSTIPNVTAQNNTVTNPIDEIDWLSTLLPFLIMLALGGFLFRLCYKAIQDGRNQDEQNERGRLALV